MGAAEARITLEHEDGMTADNDGQLDVGEAGEGGGPEAGSIDHDGRVDHIARRRGHARHASARLANRRHLLALLDHCPTLPRCLGIAGGDGRGVAVAGAGLVEDGAEGGGIDGRLDAIELRGLQDLRPHSQASLQGERLLERRAHGRAHPDEGAAADEAGLAGHRIAEALEDGERAEHHLRCLRRGIELADDAHGAAGAARADEATLEDDHALHAEAGKLEGERAAGDAAAHDHRVGRLHGAPRSRTGSPCLMAPVLSTRA